MGTVRFILFMMVIGGARPAFSQVVSNFTPAGSQESFFLYEVKLIEEFIERFNDDSDSYVREQSRTLYGTDSMINRRRMLRSLFNKRQHWNADTARFISQVTDPARPQLLSFTDTGWYAEVKTVFLISGAKTNVTLVLHMKPDNGGYKWMIAGMSPVTITAVPAVVAAKVAESGYIPTSAYGTGFVIFHQLFTPSALHVPSYFEPQLAAMPRGQLLINAVLQVKATFLQVQSVRYHFCNIPGWQFTVDQFKRKETNTGWLISSLQPVDEKAKEASLKKLLFP